MRRLFVTIGLEVYAVFLALMQMGGGVRTDEAKYLLDIPYPHPPVFRFFLSQFDAWNHQELFVRILFATLMVQAVWLVWDMARELPQVKKFTVAALWILSGGVLLQAGTVMMAPLTALQALVLLWMIQNRVSAPYIGLLWLFSIFTAYQIVLFFPLVYMCFQGKKDRIIYFGVPVVLLALYTLANPLIPASMVVHSSRDLTTSTVLDRVLATGRLWAVGGSVFFSILGTWGMFKAKRWSLIMSFIFVCAYIALSRYDYYAVLFLPLLVAGVLARPKLLSFPRVTTVLTAVVGVQFAFTLFSGLTMSTAREAIRSIEAMGTQGTLLIEGSFGHEWQYESSYPVRRFTEGLVEEAGAVVCLQECPEWNKRSWKVLQHEPEVWVREKWLG